MLHLTKSLFSCLKIEKMPDEISRPAPSFVRCFIYFKGETGLFPDHSFEKIKKPEPDKRLRSWRLFSEKFVSVNQEQIFRQCHHAQESGRFLIETIKPLDVVIYPPLRSALGVTG